MKLIAYGTFFLIGGFATVWGGGRFVEWVMKDYSAADGGLDGAGKKIGFFERALVFVLVFADAPAAIGFLITAKSILRFSDMSRSDSDKSSLTQRERSEYVIIGTLASFAWAVSVAYITKYMFSVVGTASWSGLLG